MHRTPPDILFLHQCSALTLVARPGDSGALHLADDPKTCPRNISEQCVGGLRRPEAQLLTQLTLPAAVPKPVHAEWHACAAASAAGVAGLCRALAAATTAAYDPDGQPAWQVRSLLLLQACLLATQGLHRVFINRVNVTLRIIQRAIMISARTCIARGAKRRAWCVHTDTFQKLGRIHDADCVRPKTRTLRARCTAPHPGCLLSAQTACAQRVH